jgi:hypothetical protein
MLDRGPQAVVHFRDERFAALRAETPKVREQPALPEPQRDERGDRDGAATSVKTVTSSAAARQ